MKLYLISDSSGRYTHEQLAHFAVQAEADFFQYREKQFNYYKHYDELLRIRDLLRGSSTRLIINDYWELAKQIQADGVHVGVEDIPLENIFSENPNCMVGATVHTPDELMNAKRFSLNYIGIGPVFGTTSKSIAYPPLGIEGLKSFVELSPFPVVAIGNIQLNNITELVHAVPNLYAVAVLSAYTKKAQDPLSVLMEFKRIID